MPSARREELYLDLTQAMRDSASRTLLLHQAVADRLGLGPTDMKALDLARDEPELTPSRLAELTGLRASSVTALVDRLERRGMIARRRSTTDRRKIIIVSTGAHTAPNRSIFEEIEAAVRQTLDDYDDDQLAAFLSLYRRLNDLAQEQAARISATGPASA
ncbi:MarR family winged helix-turn-helix transcriptional regulator [Pseudonocardia sp. DLS-67]